MSTFLQHKFQSLYLGVVSSTAFQALGAGCPIVVPEGSDYFRPLESEVLHYNDVSELTKTLTKLFRDEEIRKNLLDAANGFVAINSPEIVAKLFIDFFVELGRPG
jgi:glycosyltransferase involved in cell wall biosynthesis